MIYVLKIVKYKVRWQTKTI